MRNRVRLLAVAVLLSLTPGAWAVEPDWTLYERLLNAYVGHETVDGVALAWVDYSALATDRRFDSLTDQLEAFDPGALENDRERLAFYINAYNILALKVVRDHWPVASIKDAGAWYRPVWKIEAGRIGGEAVSLDHIEHELLRPLGDPRVHFAIVCASRSCPDLVVTAYRAETLEAQLDQQVQAFLDNPGKGLVATAEGVRISKIFDWFEQDFDVAGGVAAFIGRYRSKPEAIVGYLPYGWAVNGD